MAQNKTTETQASVATYLAAIADGARRRDCEALTQMMSRVTKHVPKMWGASIVGFGKYHYRYESGREGNSCLTGFSSRARDITLYLMANSDTQQELLAKLGKYKMGKACLYIGALQDVDAAILEQLVAASVAEVQSRYP